MNYFKFLEWFQKIMINTTNIIDKYAKHNKDIFSVKNYNNDNSKILIEFHGCSAHICFPI